MKTIQVKLYKAVIFLVLPAFMAGWVVAVNFSGVFETGYKMAFLDIKSAIKESINDGQPFFYMNGVKIFSENFAKDAGPENSKRVRENNAEKKENKKKVFSISYNLRD